MLTFRLTWVRPLSEDTFTEVWDITHFWVSYGRCAKPGSPMGWSEGLSRHWATLEAHVGSTKIHAYLQASGTLMAVTEF